VTLGGEAQLSGLIGELLEDVGKRAGPREGERVEVDRAETREERC
jgi:hypothetical protein